MASGRVTGHAQSFQISVTRMRPKEFIGRTYVLKCARPGSAWISYTPVFHIPRCDSSFCQCCAEMSSVREIVFGSPVAAMNKEDNGMRPLAVRHTDIHKLIGVGAIHHSVIRIGRFPAQDGFFHVTEYKCVSRRFAD